jgi:hypothetical protein
MWPFSLRPERPIRGSGQAPGMRRKLGLRLLLAGLLATVLAVAVATIASGLDLDDGTGRSATASAAGCAAATAQTIAAVQSDVARRIYAGEIDGTETRLDAARVKAYRPLLAALASGTTSAVRSAVHALVYKPHWHIVRLRVLRGSRVLADVGGPHVLAPVRGSLRVNGSVIGSYVMSVQDDLGYVKLVSRFIGAPVDLYSAGAFVMGTLAPAPAANAAAVSAAGSRYLAVPLSLRAFPAGPLQASLFVPDAPSASSCAAVRLAAFGSVARHVAARLHPLSTHLRALADIVRTVTGGHMLVIARGRRVAGAGPARVPQSGSVGYEGRRWAVYSWQPLPDVRAFVLASR